MDIDPHRIIAHPVTAGFLGALAGTRIAPGLTWFERIVNIVAGAACAGYLAPAAAELFNLTSPVMRGGLGFFVGMFGMSIAAAGLEAIRTLALAEIIRGWLKRPGS